MNDELIINELKKIQEILYMTLANVRDLRSDQGKIKKTDVKLYTKESLKELSEKIDCRQLIANEKIPHEIYRDIVLMACPHCQNADSNNVKYSMIVSQNIYYCAKCGCKGDAVNFTMETKDMFFTDALDYLAKMFNVKLLIGNK